MRSRARSPPRPSRDLFRPKLTIRRGLFKKIGSPTLKLNPLDRRESSVTISQGDKTMLQTSEPEPTSLSSTGVSGPQRGRASWTGILQVSLVAVPVKAYPATSTTETLRFNQLHAGCKQRIRYEKHCPSHGKVEAAEIVKGYPYAPDQYVVVEDSELDRLRPPKEKALLLEQFVEAGQVEPVRLSGRTLYLFPDGLPAQRSYLLLAEAMQTRNCCAVGRITMSGRRHGSCARWDGSWPCTCCTMRRWCGLRHRWKQNCGMEHRPRRS